MCERAGKGGGSAPSGASRHPRMAGIEAAPPESAVAESVVASFLPLYKYVDLERAAGGFAPESALGSGSSGTVYAANLGGGASRANTKCLEVKINIIFNSINEVKIPS